MNGKQKWAVVGAMFAMVVVFIIASSVITKAEVIGTSAERNCIGTKCTITNYAGLRFVQEDGRWVKLEDSTVSLLPYYNIQIIEQDPDYKVTLKSLTYDSIEFNIETTDSVKSTIPIEAYTTKTNYTTSVVTKENVVKLDTSKLSAKQVLDFPTTNPMQYTYKFGANSTIVTLTTPDTQILDDATISINTPDVVVGGTDISMEINSAVNNVVYLAFFIKANITNISGTVTNATFCGYTREVYQGGLTYNSYHVTNQTWVEEAITWNTNPCIGTGTYGCNKTSQSLSSTLGFPDAGWACADMTNGVKKDVADGKTNTSAFFNATFQATYRDTYFLSKEAATKPYINITYDEPAPAAVPVINGVYLNMTSPVYGTNGMSAILNCSDTDIADTLTASCYFKNGATNMTSLANVSVISSAANVTMLIATVGNFSGGDIINATCGCSDGTNTTFGSSSLATYLGATPSLTLTIDGDSTAAQTRNYPNATTFSLTESNIGDGGCSYSIKENGTDMSSTSYSKSLGAGSYNITGYTTGCTNYTGGQSTIMLTMNKKMPSIGLITTPSTNPLPYGTALNVTMYITEGDVGSTLLIWYNGVAELPITNPLNGYSIVYPAGAFNFTSQYLSTQNYTLNQTEYIITITPKSSTLNMSINGFYTDKTFRYGTLTNVTALSNDTVCNFATVMLKLDGIVVTNPNVDTLDIGVYNYTTYLNTTSNCTATQLERELEIVIGKTNVRVYDEDTLQNIKFWKLYSINDTTQMIVTVGRNSTLAFLDDNVNTNVHQDWDMNDIVTPRNTNYTYYHSFGNYLGKFSINFTQYNTSSDEPAEILVSIYNVYNGTWDNVFNYTGYNTSDSIGTWIVSNFTVDNRNYTYGDYPIFRLIMKQQGGLWDYGGNILVNEIKLLEPYTYDIYGEANIIFSNLNITDGLHTMLVEGVEYPSLTRKYLINIDTNNNAVYDMYLSRLCYNMYFQTIEPGSLGGTTIVPNATVTIQKLIGSIYKTVAQDVTNSASPIAICLRQSLPYRLIATKLGYLANVNETASFYYTGNTINILMTRAALSSNLTSPLAGDVLTMLPVNSYISNLTTSFNISCSVTSASNHLSYVVLNVTNSSGYSQNMIVTTTSGTTILSNVNRTGSYRALCGYKAVVNGTTYYYNITRNFFYYTNTGVAGAGASLVGYIDEGTLQFLALFITMMAAGFFVRIFGIRNGFIFLLIYGFILTVFGSWGINTSTGIFGIMCMIWIGLTMVQNGW